MEGSLGSLPLANAGIIDELSLQTGLALLKRHPHKKLSKESEIEVPPAKPTATDSLRLHEEVSHSTTNPS